MNISRRVCWFFLVIVSLIAVLLPWPVLAQDDKIDLELTLAPDGYYNKIIPDQDNIFFLEVRNTGNRTLTDIRLRSIPPSGWLVEFKPQQIESLRPSSFQTVEVNIKPASGAGKGEYRINFVAETEGAQKVRTIWVRLERATSLWLWIGTGLAVLVIAAFVFIFLRSSRQ